MTGISEKDLPNYILAVADQLRRKGFADSQVSTVTDTMLDVWNRKLFYNSIVILGTKYPTAMGDFGNSSLPERIYRVGRCSHNHTFDFEDRAIAKQIFGRAVPFVNLWEARECAFNIMPNDSSDRQKFNWREVNVDYEFPT